MVLPGAVGTRPLRVCFYVDGGLVVGHVLLDMTEIITFDCLYKQSPGGDNPTLKRSLRFASLVSAE